MRKVDVSFKDGLCASFIYDNYLTFEKRICFYLKQKIVADFPYSDDYSFVFRELI